MTEFVRLVKFIYFSFFLFMSPSCVSAKVFGVKLLLCGNWWVGLADGGERVENILWFVSGV